MTTSANETRLLAPATLTICCFLIMVACGGGSGSSSSGEQVPKPKVTVDRNMWNWAWETAAESQRDAIRDGEVTFAEYEAAALKTAKCITDAGMQGQAIFNSNTKTYQLDARHQSLGSFEADEGLREAADACYEAHWYGVDQAWVAQNQPSQQVLELALRALAQCLREAGLDVPDPPDSLAVSAHKREPPWIPCLQRVGTEYGLPNYGGGN